MKIIDDIVNFYNGRIDKYKNEFINATISVLGSNSKNFIKHKVDTLMPIYVVSREGIDKTLETLDLHSSDEQLISYLENFINDNEKYYLGHYGYLKPSTIDLINKTNRSYVLSYYEPTNSIGFHYEQDIYNGLLSKDLLYINHLLIYSGIVKEGNNFCLSTGNIKDEELLDAFSSIINQLSILILIKLRVKNIYVLDNKSMVPGIKDYISALSPCFLPFYYALSDIMYLFVVDFERFINLVGKDNFLKFYNSYINNDIDNLEGLINDMLNYNYGVSFPNMSFNLSLIETSFKRYKRKLEQ